MQTGRRVQMVAVQVLSHLALGVIVVWLVKRREAGAFATALFTSGLSAWQVILALLGGIALAFLMDGVLRRTGVETPQAMRRILDRLGVRASFILLGLAGLYEEFLFRGVLQGLLMSPFGQLGALSVAWAVFTAVHVPQYRRTPVFIAEVAVMSALCGAWFALAGNLLGPIVLHAAFNVQLAYLQRDSMFSKNREGEATG
ncbi:MAG: CPBP family intramembrane glutamic endopeptidase [Bacilli bacterium]